MHVKKMTVAAVLGAASLAVFALLTACSDRAAEAPQQTDESPVEPDVTFYVVGFHWGWAVFDEQGRELDAIRVTQGTTVELYAVNNAAEKAIDQFPAAVATAVKSIDWDGERTRREIEEGRLPDPELLLGMSLEEVMGEHGEDEMPADGAQGDDEMPADGEMLADGVHGDDEMPADDAHDMAAWRTPWEGEERDLETHGFLIPWYGVAAKLEPDADESVRVVFTADRMGTFQFVCTVYCGFGHAYQPRDMLFVEPAQSQ